MQTTDRHVEQPMLGVKRRLWRKDDEHADAADINFQPVRVKALNRDNYTCRYCGFKASKYQEVHHLDDDHQNNALENLLTVCNLCHQVFHLGMCAMRNGGFIAVIPELTQTEINNIVRGIFVGSMLSDKHHDKLQGLYAILEYRGSDTLKTIYGIDISNPYVFAEILSLGDSSIFENRAILMKPLRLIASKNAFHSGQLEYYAKSYPDTFMPDNWIALSRQLM